MEYKQQTKDIIERTEIILQQYEEYFKDKPVSELEKKYEVTLFINCLVGLLIIPEQELFDELPTVPINKANWGINPDDISFSRFNSKSVKDVLIHLRNSISHYRFDAISSNKKIIWYC